MAALPNRVWPVSMLAAIQLGDTDLVHQTRRVHHPAGQHATVVYTLGLRLHPVGREVGLRVQLWIWHA